MFVTKAALLFTSCLLFQESVLAGCPFSKKSDGEIPNDCAHKGVRGRRLASLKHDEVTKKNIASFFESREGRLLQTGGCPTTEVMEVLKDDIDQLSAAIGDVGHRSHFLGGIVRLAAHDFMDFDRNDLDEPGGSDGCLDLTADPNAGLDTIWCDEPVCPYKLLFDTVYNQYMSKADFWVAGATMVVELTSVLSTPIPFKYGRPDNTDCPSSSSRLPADSGCSAVEGVFIDRMGLSWTDATALLGAHTLGRGDAAFSGHPGTWVDTDEESTIFNKRYYRELLFRGWRPRVQPAGTDWIWGGQTRTVMMLNADICLAFDIPDGNDQDCCTNTRQNCRDFTTLCPTSESVRQEAFDAVHRFNDGNENVFFDAFSEAWIKATENGINNLTEVTETCGTPAPTPVTTPAPTPVTTPAPTTATTPAPTADCVDIEGLWENDKGRPVDCSWVLEKNKCNRYGLSWCPFSCGFCTCEDELSFEAKNGITRNCDWVLLKPRRCDVYGLSCRKSCGIC